MILRNEKPRPNYYTKKQVVRYAYLPTRLKRAPDDKDGEIIWLEKYVKIYIHVGKKSKKTWQFDESLRFTVHVLNEMNSEKALAEDMQDVHPMKAYGQTPAGLQATFRSNKTTSPTI